MHCFLYLRLLCALLSFPPLNGPSFFFSGPAAFLQQAALDIGLAPGLPGRVFTGDASPPVPFAPNAAIPISSDIAKEAATVTFLYPLQEAAVRLQGDEARVWSCACCVLSIACLDFPRYSPAPQTLQPPQTLALQCVYSPLSLSFGTHTLALALVLYTARRTFSQALKQTTHGFGCSCTAGLLTWIKTGLS